MKDNSYNSYDRTRPSVQLFDSFLNDIDLIAYERDMWKEKYNESERKYQELLNNSVKSQNELTGQILTAFLHKADLLDEGTNENEK